MPWCRFCGVPQLLSLDSSLELPSTEARAGEETCARRERSQRSEAWAHKPESGPAHRSQRRACAQPQRPESYKTEKKINRSGPKIQTKSLTVSVHWSIRCDKI